MLNYTLQINNDYAARADRKIRKEMGPNVKHAPLGLRMCVRDIGQQTAAPCLLAG